MNDFYENEYYQNDIGYIKKNNYSEDELKYFDNLNAEREFIINHYMRRETIV